VSSTINEVKYIPKKSLDPNQSFRRELIINIKIMKTINKFILICCCIFTAQYSFSQQYYAPSNGEKYSDYEIKQWIRINSDEIEETVNYHYNKVKEYDIPYTMYRKDPGLIYLLLNSKSLADKKEKQEWFDLYSLMQKQQISNLYDILIREGYKLAEIEKKHQNKLAEIEKKYSTKGSSSSSNYSNPSSSSNYSASSSSNYSGSSPSSNYKEESSESSIGTAVGIVAAGAAIYGLYKLFSGDDDTSTGSSSSSSSSSSGSGSSTSYYAPKSMDNVEILGFNSENNLFTVGHNNIALSVRNKNSYDVYVIIEFTYNKKTDKNVIWDSEKRQAFKVKANSIETINTSGEAWSKAKDIRIVSVR